jgi:hypothetical protein
LDEGDFARVQSFGDSGVGQGEVEVEKRISPLRGSQIHESLRSKWRFFDVGRTNEEKSRSPSGMTTRKATAKGKGEALAGERGRGGEGISPMRGSQMCEPLRSKWRFIFDEGED